MIQSILLAAGSSTWFGSNKLLRPLANGMAVALAAARNLAAALPGTLADMPSISPQTLRAAAEGVRQPLDIVAPVHDGRRGHPVAFGRAHGPALSRLKGDTGARAVLHDHQRQLILLACDDPGVFQDIDSPEHLSMPSRQRKPSTGSQ